MQQPTQSSTLASTPASNPAPLQEVLIVAVDRTFMGQMQRGEVTYIPKVSIMDYTGFKGPALLLDNTVKPAAFIGVAKIQDVRDVTSAELTKHQAVRPDTLDYAWHGLIIEPGSVKPFLHPVVVAPVKKGDEVTEKFARVSLDNIVKLGMGDDAAAAVCRYGVRPTRPAVASRPEASTAEP